MKYGVFTKSATEVSDPNYCGCDTFWSVDFVDDTKEEALATASAFGPGHCCVAKVEEVPDGTEPGDLSEGITYVVQVPQVHYAEYVVKATSPEEAKLLVALGEQEEYDCEFDRNDSIDTFTVTVDGE